MSRIATIVILVIVIAGGAIWALTDRNVPCFDAEAAASSDAHPYPIVTFCMASGNEIKMELYPDIAPNTVNNFLHLASTGFYDGLTFHRIVPGFVIQGGDPLGTGFGGPGYGIKGEFAANGHPNNLAHERGVVSMARSNHPDSAGSQFFIVLEAAPHLDGGYAAFGRVIEGMEEVDRIVEDEVEPRIVSATVETFGVTYPEPERISAP